MKAVTAVVDGLQFSEAQLDTFYQLADSIGGVLTIAFLEHDVEEMYPLAAANPELFTYTFEGLNLPSSAELERRVKEGRERLGRFASDKQITMPVHTQAGTPTACLLQESRFTDMLLINRLSSFSNLVQATAYRLLPDILAGAQCPVMILPEVCPPVSEVVFAYNGSQSSLFAIREFTRLMSCYSQLPATVLYAVEKQDPIPFATQLRDYLSHYYKQISFLAVEGQPATVLAKYADEHPKAVITMGAYGRSMTSRFFHQSDATRLLYHSSLPLFITHV